MTLIFRARPNGSNFEEAGALPPEVAQRSGRVLKLVSRLKLLTLARYICRLGFERSPATSHSDLTDVIACGCGLALLFRTFDKNIKISRTACGSKLKREMHSSAH
jgi:hypothetical protein